MKSFAHHYSSDISREQCVTYGHIGGAENYWHCK